MTSSKFLVLIVVQLCIPATLYLLVHWRYDGAAALKYLLPNYLFMAAPHLLASLLTIRPKARCSALLWVLSLLNATLIAYKFLLIQLAEPDPAIWLYYIPLWMLVLSACAVTWLVVKYSRSKSRVGAG